MVRGAATRMLDNRRDYGTCPAIARRRNAGIPQILFRGLAHATGATCEIALKRDNYRYDKRHGWLKVEDK